MAFQIGVLKMFHRFLRQSFSSVAQSSAQTKLEPTEASKKFFRVKLYRGFIGLPEKYREWAHTLGLKKRGQTNYVPVMPKTMGAIIKLKELLKVDLVDEKPASINPVYPKGYEVIDNYLEKPILNVKQVD